MINHYRSGPRSDSYSSKPEEVARFLRISSSLVDRWTILTALVETQPLQIIEIDMPLANNL
jgi:hypothetical protein